MTQDEKRALIATQVMGWHVETPPYGPSSIDETGGDVWVDCGGNHRCWVGDYRPDEFRDQLAQVEAALREEQQKVYLNIIIANTGCRIGTGLSTWGAWQLRTAPPAVCVDAMVEILEGEKI